MGTLSEYINGAQARVGHQNHRVRPSRGAGISYDVQVSADKLMNTLNFFVDDDAKKEMLFNAVKEGAIVLRDEARETFRKDVKGATHSDAYTKGKPLYETIKMIGDKAYTRAVVSIMGDYRLKWFEKGAPQGGGDRMTKGKKMTNAQGKYIKTKSAKTGKWSVIKRDGSGHSTGNVTATNFFAESHSSASDRIDEAIITSINNAIKQIGG